MSINLLQNHELHYELFQNSGIRTVHISENVQYLQTCSKMNIHSQRSVLIQPRTSSETCAVSWSFTSTSVLSLAFLLFVFENSSQPAPVATTKFKSLNPATLQSRWVSTKVRRKFFKISGNLWKFFESFRTFQMSMPRMIIASSKSTDTICKAKLGEFSRLPLYLLSRIQLCTSCTNALSFFIQFSYLLRIFLLSHLR